MQPAPYREPGHDLSMPIQAIRVAAALNARCGDLMRSKLTDQLGIGDVESVAGEVRQVYPAMWSQLDSARASLARHGIDVSTYDAVRGTGPIGDGIVEVALEKSTSLVRRGDKTVYFDGQGLTAADAACRALKAALPQVDWEALDRADDAAMVDLRPARWKRIAVMVIAGVIMAGVAIGIVISRMGMRGAFD
jgi:hypothetical protein